MDPDYLDKPTIPLDDLVSLARHNAPAPFSQAGEARGVRDLCDNIATMVQVVRSGEIVAAVEAAVGDLMATGEVP
jgi:hypothetical protein